MINPFSNRAASLQGPATDIQPVSPSDSVELPVTGIALYVESGGTISVVTVAGQDRVVEVPDFAILPCGIRRVNATGTTASGIHVLVLV